MNFFAEVFVKTAAIRILIVADRIWGFWINTLLVMVLTTTRGKVEIPGAIGPAAQIGRLDKWNSGG